MKKILVIAMLFCTATVFAQNITEYCNDGTLKLGIIMHNTTPKDCFAKNSTSSTKIVAAINGTYFDANGDPEGLVMRSTGFTENMYAYGSGEIRGYLYVTDTGIYAGKMCPRSISDNSASMWIIGTHPLLVSGGRISMQSTEKRYNYNDKDVPTKAYRSALGTKDGVHLCMAVSNKPMGMAEWASELFVEGYTQAINLDGGPISQLVGPNGTFGGGGSNSPTKLIFYFYK